MKKKNPCRVCGKLPRRAARRGKGYATLPCGKKEENLSKILYEDEAK